MDNNNKMESHPRIHLYTPAAPKILVPSSASFNRIVEPIYQERPMTLNAWTQTTNEDAEYLRAEHHHHEQRQPFQDSENERRLLEKIRALEEKLLEQTQLLSQIHATSAGSRSSLQLQTSHSEHNNITSPTSTSLINQFQQEPKETIKYTIIADGNGTGNGTDEPIEIHLAEDDGALNLNSSADSERLEIYIADEQVGIKTETLKSEEELGQSVLRKTTLAPTSQTTATTPTLVAVETAASQPPPPPTPTTSETQPIKRRKIDMKSSPQSRPITNVYINQNGLLRPVNMNTSSNSASTGKFKQDVLTPMATYSNINATPLSDPPQKKKAALKLKKNILQSSTDQTNVQKMGERAMVSIGPNNTLIPEEIYMGIPWKSASIATRRLLMTIFDRPTLATHSMTGKPSPAFKDQNKPLKKMLDRTKVEDILYAVTTKCNVTEKEVRNAITTKCADENKMMKLQMGKNNAFGSVNKENVSSEMHKV